MKTNLKLAVFALCLTALMPAAHAQLTIPGANGSDGALNITTNTVIDLSQAVTAAWNTSNTGTNVGKGVYDSNQWAVVFKYSSVTIASNCMVTFKNHGSRAPVVWLVNGNVTINGILDLSGSDYVAAPDLAEPGPGGFRGGSGYYAAYVNASAGLGPGGGQYDWRAGSHATVAEGNPATYGNPSVVPLIGGSGGSGRQNSSERRSGGAGGGAILIASINTISVNGLIRADGGYGAGANGSGGSVRLVCDSLTGKGVLQCTGNSGSWSRPGGLGRVRIERVATSSLLQIIPDPSVVPLEAGSAPLLWLPSDGPTVRVVSIGAVAPPADPRAEFGAVGADVTLPQTSSVPVVVETVNAEAASTVLIRGTPRAGVPDGGYYNEATANLEQIVSTSPLVIRWTNNLPVVNGYWVVQARLIRP